MSIVLSLQQVRKDFAGQSVLKNINLDVAEHEFIAILGSDGSRTQDLDWWYVSRTFSNI